jgi:hypothetical protein
MKASSRRPRKRHVQQELFRRGGKRKNAGRKPKGARAGSPHQERPTIKPTHALHVVLRIVAAVGNLRRRSLYSGLSFPDWKELEGKDVMWPIREGYDPLFVRRPASWLLKDGWKLCGSISVHDIPSQRP